MAEKSSISNGCNSLKKVKSKYILKQIFDNIQENILLEIIRYNKNLKNKLSKRLEDYKKLFSKIEIEIIPLENHYGKFIHIHNKILEPYFHIYFNDSTNEIKRNYTTKDDQVNKIKVIIDYRLKSLYGIFLQCTFIKKINFIKFNRYDIKMFGYMFYNCSSLEELNISAMITDNATNMRCMFYRCSSLKKLNLSNFNTKKVINMSYMFNYCSSLKELNISNFNTSNVKDMSYMFDGCSSLKSLNISNFRTNNLINMERIFYGCSSIKEIKFIKFYH